MDSSNEVVEMTQEEIKNIIKRYEDTFGISSQEFIQRMHDGMVPDMFETMDWAILLHYRNQNAR